MRFFRWFLKDNHVNFTIYLFCSLLGNILLLLIAFELRHIYSEGIGQVQWGDLSLLMAYGAGNFLCRMAIVWFSTRVRQKGRMNLAMNAVSRLLRTDYSYFLMNDPKEIPTSIHRSAESISQYFVDFCEILSQTVTFFVYGYILWNIHSLACMSAFIFLILLLAATMWAVKRTKGVYGGVLACFRGLSSAATETISAVMNIKAKNAYGYFGKKVKEKHDNLNRTIVAGGALGSYQQAVQSFLISLAPLAMVCFLARLEGQDVVQMPDVVMLFTFLPSFITSTASFYGAITGFFRTKPDFSNLEGYFDLGGEISGTKEIKGFETFQTKNACIVYSGREPLAVPDMEIKKGDSVLILGESGTGKSSLFLLLTGLHREYRGNIYVNGKELREIAVESLRRIFLPLLQEANIFSMTMEENIVLGGEREKAPFLIEMMGLADLQDKNRGAILRNNTVSGGERARIGVARALAAGSEALLLDESLSGVDGEMEEDILRKIMSDRRGKTFFYIAHRIPQKISFDKVVRYGKVSYEEI